MNSRKAPLSLLDGRWLLANSHVCNYRAFDNGIYACGHVVCGYGKEFPVSGHHSPHQIRFGDAGSCRALVKPRELCGIGEYEVGGGLKPRLFTAGGGHSGQFRWDWARALNTCGCRSAPRAEREDCDTDSGHYLHDISVGERGLDGLPSASDKNRVEGYRGISAVVTLSLDICHDVRGFCTKIPKLSP